MFGERASELRLSTSATLWLSRRGCEKGRNDELKGLGPEAPPSAPYIEDVSVPIAESREAASSPGGLFALGFAALGLF